MSTHGMKGLRVEIARRRLGLFLEQIPGMVPTVAAVAKDYESDPVDHLAALRLVALNSGFTLHDLRAYEA